MSTSAWTSTLVLAALCITAACNRSETGKWENPSVSQSTWEVHEAECRRLAARRAEDEFRSVEPGVGSSLGRQSQLRSQMARYDAGENRDYLFDRCMKDRGYRRAARPAAAETPR